MAEQTGPRATASRIRKDLPDIRYTLERLPTVARRLVDQILEPDSGMSIPNHKTLYQRERRQYLVIAGAAVLVAGALLIGLNARPVWLGWCVSAAGLMAIYLGRPKPSSM